LSNPHPARRLWLAAAATVALAGALTMHAKAEPISASSASSASSQSISASVGSISNSITGSSNASSGNDNQQQADRDYRITEVAALDERPGELRLKLEPLDAQAGGFYLHLPRTTAERHGVAAGEVIAARARPYGLAFTRGPAREPFFLAVTDDWLRELQTRALPL
jgi:hypothetical protein